MLISGFLGRQPTDDVSSSELSLLFARPTVTFPLQSVTSRWPLPVSNFLLLGERLVLA